MSRLNLVADAVEGLFALYVVEWSGLDLDQMYQMAKLPEWPDDVPDHRRFDGFTERLAVIDGGPGRADGRSELAIIARLLAFSAYQYNEWEQGAGPVWAGRKWTLSGARSVA